MRSRRLQLDRLDFSDGTADVEADIQIRDGETIAS
jgi:hypothetical protein